MQSRYSMLVAFAAMILFVDFVAAQKLDRYGDPLPEGAIARLGTIRFRHEANSTTGVVFSPNGKLIATATNNSPYVFVFDVATGQRVAHFGPEDPNVHIYWLGASLTFEEDSQSLLIMLMGGNLERLDIKTGKRETLGKPSINWRGSCTTSDGKLIAIVDAKGTIHILEYATLKTVTSWQLGDETELNAFSFDSAAKRLALGDRKRKKFELWDIGKNEVSWTAEGTGSNFQIALSPSGAMVAYTPGKQGFTVRKLGQEKPVLEVTRGNPPKSFTFSPDESTLIALNSSTFEFWNLDEGKVERKQEIGFAKGAYYSPDGKIVALAKSSHAIRLFDANSGDELPKFETHYDDIKGIGVSHDGSRALTRAWGDTVKTWDVGTQKPILSIDTRSLTPKAMAITPDGKRIAYARNGLHIYDPESGKQLHKLSARSCEVLAVSPGGSLLAASDQVEGKPSVSIVNIATGEKKQLFQPEQRVKVIRWLPDGKQLITSEYNGDIRLWNAESGKLIRDFKRPAKGGVSSLAVHPKGKVLATTEGGFDGKLWLYRIETGELLDVTLEGYDPERRAPAQGVAFTGDGRYLVARLDWRLHIWDLQTRKRVAQLGSRANFISAFALSGDGRRLVTSSAFDHLLVWDIEKLIGR